METLIYPREPFTRILSLGFFSLLTSWMTTRPGLLCWQWKGRGWRRSVQPNSRSSSRHRLRREIAAITPAWAQGQRANVDASLKLITQEMNTVMTCCAYLHVIMSVIVVTHQFMPCIFMSELRGATINAGNIVSLSLPRNYNRIAAAAAVHPVG